MTDRSRDWNPAYQRGDPEYPVDAVRAAYQRGVDAERARLLARVRELPSPAITHDLVWSRCQWCMAQWRFNLGEHPANGCLWVEAVSGPSDTPATLKE